MGFLILAVRCIQYALFCTWNFLPKTMFPPVLSRTCWEGLNLSAIYVLAVRLITGCNDLARQVHLQKILKRPQTLA